VSMRFAVWTLTDVSLAVLILVSLAAGLVIAGVPLWLQRWSLRRRARTLEARVRQLEISLADRDRALLVQRPAPAPPRDLAAGGGG
jgi:lipopolysaccharide assembly LapA-like protein